LKYTLYKLTLALCCLLCSSLAYAQAKSNLVKKYIPTTTDTLVLDAFSMVPNTFYISNVLPTTYKLDYVTATLIWLQKQPQDSVFVSYRTFPYTLKSTVQLYVFDSVKNNFLVTPYTPKVAENSSNLFDFGNIEYTGSFGRGISFGNAQDAVVNSNLNLQLNGMIGDSIEIAASLSDQNLPIQPDGSTTQLNEIDKIFIQFKKRTWNLSLGDIDIRQNNHYYLNFYKRLQGISFETTNRIYKNITNTVLVSGALAKGKFTTNTFQGLEGNQGPYRLQGANNEFFFIVLGNSERVYIDGELLQRGEDQDYIINYNTAEITFTPQKLITKDKRIRVEFEYSDRNYVNSQLFVSDQINFSKKLQVRISAYSNNDAKNSPINQTLNPAQKLFLGTVGDSIQNAYYPTVLLDTLSPGKILYKEYDSLVNSVLQKIYIYSTDVNNAKYNLSFADLGQGKGNYQVLLNGANGKVFVWIRPVAGIKQGRYEPVQFLIAPKKQQLVSITTDYAISDKSTIKLELASSSYDLNRFSKLDKQNDKGLAGKLQWLHTAMLSKKMKLATDASYELNNKNFRTIERLRSPEFNRDWNLPFVTELEQEQLGSITANLNHENGNLVKLQFSNFLRANGYAGYRQIIATQSNTKGWQLGTQFSYTSTNDNAQKGLFVRPTIDITKTFTKLRRYKIGFNFFAEQNKLLNKIADTLNPLSIAFDSWKFSLSSNEAKENKWSLAYIVRNNKIPIGKQLQLSDKSEDLEALLFLRANPHHKFNFKATYRNLDVVLPNRVSYKSDKTLLGRAEYEVNEWRGLLMGNVLIETGSGQEQKRDFAFLEVPAGQGEYYWIDYNNNAVQELNEFELAQFPDQRKFIKIFIPTNEFTKANFSNFNYGIVINPKAAMLKPNYKGIKKIISKLYLQSSLQIAKKEQSASVININPFKYSVDNASLISLNYVFSNSLSFNKFSTRWGFDINQDNRSNKSLLTYGYEGRTISSYIAKLRWNVGKNILLENISKKIQNQLSTPSFGNRNYDVQQLYSEMKISFTKNNKLRVGTAYQLEQKQNSVLYGGEKATINSVAIEAKYNALQSAGINGKFTYSTIVYNGLPNTTVAYIMLDALVPGKNLLWNIDFVKTLKNNLEIGFRYEGRKTGEAKTVHIGSATMRANFY
jgi:hypothetical protein